MAVVSMRSTMSGPVTLRLTPQERHVSLAVANGATNDDVARELFLSRKTVEFHLTSVYRKLGVTSRSQLTRLIVLDEARTD
jgi:LuxR family transcriptional regulator, maltose regulon positive regulatory protein